MTSTAPAPLPDRYGSQVLPRWIDSFDSSLEKHPGLWLLAFTIPYFLAAVGGSAVKPLWFDELFTYYISSQPDFSRVLGAIRFDSHPPLSFLLTHLSQLLFGRSELATRLPEIAGLWLLCVCLYVFVRRSSRPLFALMAAIIIPTTAVFSFALEARPYAVVLGWAGVALISWQTAIGERRRYVGLAALTLSMASALCCHYYAPFDIVLPLAIGEAVRTFTRKRVDWAVWFAFVMSLLPLIWLWPHATAASTVFAEHIRNSPVFWAKPTPTRIFDFYAYLLGHAVLPMVIALAGVAFAGMVTRFPFSFSTPTRIARTQPSHELAAAIGFLFIPVVLLIFTRLRTGYFMDRYALTSVIGAAILVVSFLSSTCSWRAASVFALAFVLSATGLRVVNAAWVMGSGGHARATYSLGIESIAGNLPVVVSNPLLYLESAHYAAPDVVARMIYLTDLPVAFQQSDPLPEYSLYVARPILPGHTEDYEKFVKGHDRFWLYYSGNPGMEWLPARLLSTGYQLRAVKQQGNMTLFDVSRGTSNQ